MISVSEYNRWLEIEARLHNRPCKIPLGFPYVTVNLDLNTRVFLDTIKPLKYDYFLHPRFGVVCALEDGGGKIGKGPLCEKLDRVLLEL